MRELNISQQTPAPRLQQRRSFYLTLAVGLAIVFLGALYAGFAPDASVDLRADRLVAMAAVDGLNPYVPVYQLAEIYGSNLGWPWVHPRPPGAIAAQTVLVLFPEWAMRAISVFGTAAAVTSIVVIAGRAIRPPARFVGLAAVVAGSLSISVEAATVGSQSSLVALLLAVAWWRTRQGDDVWAGVAVGLAVTLKLWPWLLVLAFIGGRRWKASAAAVATGLALTVAGLAFPGVSLADAITTLTERASGTATPINASIARVLGEHVPARLLTIVFAVVAITAAAWILRRGWDWDRTWFAVTAVALAASPIVWSHYALALLLPFAWFMWTGDRVARNVVGAACLTLFVPHTTFTAQVAIPVCVIAVLWLVARHATSRSSGTPIVS